MHINKAKHIMIYSRKFLEGVFSKRILILFLFVLAFFLIQDRLIFFINDKFLISPDFSNSALDILIILSSVLLTLFLIYKLIFQQYLPSFLQKTFAAALLVLILYFQNKRAETPWRYLSDSFFDINYVWFLFIPIAFASSIYFAQELGKLLNLILPRFGNFDFKNSLIGDNPIELERDDLLDYKPKVDRLTSILLNEKHQKSFSIGLVGPWGNGKSSVINMVKGQIDKTSKEDDNILVIHFLPFLNHKEDDIINEFFISLSNELSRYSGKLSNRIISYANKLTDLYNGGNLFGFFEKHVTSFNNSSAKELYEEINDLLEKINKKIIVFVDDLDRLNGLEILQVLKLIRNTADFRNTIFVVAMDKDYVINRLKANNNITSTRFIDKFFQLEIYLPEIDKSILRKYVLDNLKSSIINSESTFEITLDKGLNNKNNLFEDYIKNIRDAKRLINQIIFDFPFLRDEINFKDFMNFTYFKLKFPKFMQLLNDNRLDFLKIENGEYKLIEKPPENNQEGSANAIGSDLLAILSTVKSNDYSYVKKYAITEHLEPDPECLKDILSVDCDDILLLSKTLAYLFGEENKVESFNSIKKENNFRMLMQQKVFKNVLKEKEFQELIKEQEPDQRKNLLYNLYSADKISQLLNRLDYFSSDEDNKIKNVVLSLLELYNKKDAYEVNEQQLLNKLAIYVERQINDEVGANNQDLVTWLKTNIFEGNNLNLEDKLSIIGELWESKDDNKLWAIDEGYIEERALLFFKEYLSKFNDTPWDVNDYSMYKFYHSLKVITDIKEKLNNEIMEFWKKSDIELLCAQHTEIPSFSYSTFGISDAVTEIYGSKAQFHDFIKNHPFEKSDAVIEFLDLYKLHQITDYSISIIFNFKHSQLMLKKIENNKQHPGRSSYDEYGNFLQIVFETNSDLIIPKIVQLRNVQQSNNTIFDQYPDIDISVKTIDLLQFSIFDFDGKHYLFVSYDKKYNIKHGILILQAFEAIANYTYKPKANNFTPYINKLTQKTKIVIVEDIYLRTISIQRAQNRTY